VPQNWFGRLKKRKEAFTLTEIESRIVKPNQVSTHTTLLKTHKKYLSNQVSSPFELINQPNLLSLIVECILLMKNLEENTQLRPIHLFPKQ
jgi:hypothetical protein